MPIPVARLPEVVAEGFGWSYRSRGKPALRNLSFTLDQGCVLLVLGPSGCGKSTLARALAGLVPHVLPGTWQGSLAVGGFDVATTPASRLGEHVGLVFQDPDSQLVMSRVEDEVAFGLENRGRPREQMLRVVPDTLRRVGLGGFERRGTATLSGGEKQRVAIADVLAPAPRLLVFDEPTANLDPPGMFETFDQLRALANRREHTIVIVEHRLEAALPLADQVLLLGDDGRQVAFGPPDEVGRLHAATLERIGGWVPERWSAWVDARAQRSKGRGRLPEQPTSPNPSAPTPPARREVLDADRVTIRYPAEAGGARPPAIEGVSLVLGEGERVALVGPNGSGKSTLLFALAGLRRPDEGVVRLQAPGGALDPVRLRSRDLARFVGFVFQDPEVGFVGRTVAAEVAASVAPGLRHLREHREAEDGLMFLERFGLADLASADPFRLSQGEQRRLSVAAAAVRPPRILLLDEPTFGLDRRGTSEVLAMLDEMRSGGQAQILATHDPGLFLACDRVIALDRGRLVFDGTPAGFASNPPFTPAKPWLPMGAVAAA